MICKMEQYKLLNFVRIFAMIGCTIGGIIFIISLFETGYDDNHLLTFAAIAIVFNSMLVFGVGLFFTITEELITKTRRVKS